MISIMWLSVAFAQAPPPAPGTLRVDTRLPAEVLIDGSKVAQLWYAGEVAFQVSAGEHVLRVYTNGDPVDLPVDVPAGADLRVMIGRTGVTLDRSEPDPVPLARLDPAALVAVEFRCVGGGGAQVRLGKQRILLSQGERQSVDLAPGRHAISVRSPEGTVIWAAGTLEVGAGEGLVVQVSDGRMPELFGPGKFHARSGG